MKKEKIKMILLSILNYIVPKKENALFFYDINGISLNEFALIRYLYSQEANQKYELSIVSNRSKLLKTIFPSDIVYHNNSRGLWKQLRAKYIFIEQNAHEWILYPSHGQKIIQLWHGLPIKKVGYLHNKSPLYPYNSVYSYVLAPSEYGWNIMQTCFHYSDEKRIICSSPRCDTMRNGITDMQYQKLGLDHKRKLILWMPTFRNNITEQRSHYGSSFPLITSKQMYLLDEFLEKNELQMVIKLHSLQILTDFLKKQYRNIFIFNNELLLENKIDPYALLGESCCLITDYSSTVYDYMLMDRPIIFTIDDLEQFKLVRGFIEEDYMAFFAGACVRNYHQLTTEILKAVHRIDQEKYDRLRHQRNTLVNQYHDFNHCRRLFQTLGLIEE